ncbi:MAG TPA: hypothetical protein PLP29_11430 [Candidatus Ozemobacteraceae bacterium]|nr:hypothetical protein [Candidatus Ozemobacteraceae bacterium]
MKRKPARRGHPRGDRGNVFLIIIGILAVIFTVATFFMRDTVEETYLTERSHRAIHAQCLAEAGLERALSILAKDLNDPEKMKDPVSLANKLRLPMKTSGGALYDGLGNVLGNDLPLDVSAVKEPVILDKARLQENNAKDLDEMVDFMVGKAGTEYDVKVTLKLDKALKIAPGPDSGADKYKVPGVDCEYAVHSGLMSFLDNKGYKALELSLPEDAKWLSLNIDLGLPFLNVDLIDLMLKVFPESWSNQIKGFVTFDGLLKKIMPEIYPYEIELAAGVFPDLSGKLGGAAVPAFSESQCVEKFGYLTIESEASIVYGDARKTTKRVFATKEFKCADIEPVAPCYSLFISNLNDDKIVFNDAGGTLMVQNFPNMKTLLAKGAGEYSAFPGLIRVNGTKPTLCNVSFYGNPMNGDVFNFARVSEMLLITDVDISMPEKEFTIYSREPHNQTTSPVPSEVKGLKAGLDNSLNNAEAQYNTIKTNVIKTINPNPPKPPEGTDKTSTLKNIASKVAGLFNIIPKISGCTVFEPPLHLLPLPGPLGSLDPFERWDWPYSGGPLSFAGVGLPIPLPAFGSCVTHLFGPGALYPTMTREIEGCVLKRFQQWHFTIMGYPMGPFPVGKQIPITGFINLPPIPIPLVHTHDVCEKYEYSFYPMKATEDANKEPDGAVTIYDPSQLENSPPNLYSIEQYAKKATYYYATEKDFLADLPNRMIKINGKDCYRLNGITFVADNLTLPPVGSSTLNVYGRGSIVSGGNVSLRGNIEDPYDDTQETTAGTPRTIFSLVVRRGGVIIDENAPSDPVRFEGNLYTDKGLAVFGDKQIAIRGNWVTNTFNKAAAQGAVKVTYVGYKTRSSLNSIHPKLGKYDPERYQVTLTPGWEAWRVQ